MSDRDNTTGSDQTKIVGISGLAAMVKGVKASKPKTAFRSRGRKHTAGPKGKK